MDAPPVALVSLLTTDRRLIYRPVQHLTSCQSGVWSGGAKINSSACQWVSSPDAWVNPGKRQFYKTATCPAGSVQSGSRFMIWPGALDDEHVDVLCCPFS